MAYPKDITGQVFGRLTAIEPTNSRKNGYPLWRCRCECGSITEVSIAHLQKGSTQSCGCLWKEKMNERRINLAGRHFGKLTAISPTSKRYRSHIIWLCQCECGNLREVSVGALTSGDVKSCGCLEKEQRVKNRIEQNVLGTNIGAISVPEEKLGKTNSSGIKGVYWSNNEQRWVAAMTFMRKRYHREYKHMDDAIYARQKMRQARDEFVDWWKALTPEQQKDISGDLDSKLVQRNLFEKRLKKFL